MSERELERAIELASASFFSYREDKMALSRSGFLYVAGASAGLGLAGCSGAVGSLSLPRNSASTISPEAILFQYNADGSSSRLVQASSNITLVTFDNIGRNVYFDKSVLSLSPAAQSMLPSQKRTIQNLQAPAPVPSNGGSGDSTDGVQIIGYTSTSGSA
jgi:outer membrane protein OmpA-like peptidoglycan-associated protein